MKTKEAPLAPKRLTLKELTDDVNVIAEWMDEHDDEMRANEGVIPAPLADLLARVQGAVNQKIERIALFIRALQQKAAQAAAEKASLRAEMEFYAAREARCNRQVESLKAYTLMCLTAMGEKKIEGEVIDVRVQTNGAAGVKVPLFTPMELASLHEGKNAFVRQDIVHTIDTAKVMDLYNLVVADIGPMPDIDVPKYLEVYTAWDSAVHEALVAQGVPAGVRVVRGRHVRFS